MFRQVIGSLAVFALSAAAAQGQPAHGSSGTPAQEQRIVELERLGGTVYQRMGRVVEVNLNRTKIGDDHLALLASFSTLTDLSLEGTAVGDRGWPISRD